MAGSIGAGLAPGRIVAVLGPTNTGKTHYALERMLAHRTGVIGLPLRLLAREVYDKIVAARGPSVVALITGEERIIPERVQYWVATVEAMPTDIGADFLAVDEIQLCADPERGHVFTDRLLHARGQHETLFLGADTMRSAIAALVPKAQFLRRERFSDLTYTGSKKISRMKPRSAIVGFSVDQVYSIAELIRRQRGGCAVVMGALSPRTRNAQVELYQNGDVDFLVSTDAIGMGLNLDVSHVAFSATAKFDGRRIRPLAANELAQIAGRAGRYQTPGTFGVTGEAGLIDDETVKAIEESRFAPIKRLQWRNEKLRFGSAAHLLASLETPPDPDSTRSEWLVRAREADDQLAFKTVSDEPEVAARLSNPRDVQLLWDVCRIPDFRGISAGDHADMLTQIYGFMHDAGRVPQGWFATQVGRIDRTDGNIDTLSKRLAYIRTWTYVAQRNGWIEDESHWRGETRAVEDRLSDALHTCLTEKFVDRRTSVLMRRLKQKESLVAEVNDNGEVKVEGELIGKLDGFRFRPEKSASPEEEKALRAASVAALAPEFHLRADRFYNAPDTEIDYTEQGGLMWGDRAVGKLVKGADALKPQVHAFVDDEAGADVTQKVQRRLQHFIDRKIAALFEPLMAMSRDEALTGLARGFAFQLVEAMGVIPREKVAADVKALDQDARGALRKHGIRFGQFTIFLPLLLKPAPTRLRLVLWSLDQGFDFFPESPPPGLVTIPVIDGIDTSSYTQSGYRAAGTRAIRIDMLERLADMLRGADTRGGFEATPDMLSITGMTLEQFSDLMAGLGYAAEKAEREKVKVVEKPKIEVTAEEIAAEAAAATEAALAKVKAEAEAAAAPEVEPETETTETAAEGEAVSEQPPAEPVEMEVFYTFKWAPKPRHPARARPQQVDAKRAEGEGGNRDRKGGGGGGPKGKGRGEGGKGGPRGKGPKPGNDGPRKFEARPPRHEKPIDPDNPFAQALMGLKDKI
ncbi:MAG: ATP-dependent RNA helicase SUPV3L1/SUV3 [Dinoroseobacter sp.]|jgi:ATP-dependent RNA helicase SUPV3L1/SUV3